MAKLTFAQREALELLRAAGAVDRETAKSILDEPRLKAVVIGRLRVVALADSRVIRPPGGSQRTAYWLTGAGLMLARQLAEA